MQSVAFLQRGSSLLLCGVMLLLCCQCKKKVASPPPFGGSNPAPSAVLKDTAQATPAGTTPLAAAIKYTQTPYFSAKAAIQYDGSQGNMGLYGVLRMQTDSLLWLSLRKFGLEVARVQITHDSVYVLDRINSQCIIQSLPALSRQYGYPLGLANLQDIVLGNAIYFDPTLPTDSAVTGRQVKLTQQEKTTQKTYQVAAASRRLMEQTLHDKALNALLTIRNSQPTITANEQDFLTQRQLSFVHQNPPQREALQVQLSELDWVSKPNFKFEIPDSYEVLRR